MKFVIFADKSYSYVRPISDGLHNTLHTEGHESVVLYNGIYWLNRMNLIKVLLMDIYRAFMNLFSWNRKKYIYRLFGLLTFNSNKTKRLLRDCDCIIVVNNCPSVFYSNTLNRLEALRSKYNKPIVNYDFHYLPNQGWYKRITQDSNHFGLERFDWYLPVGLVTEFAIPKQIPKIYSCIGMDIKKENLFPEQKEFKALVDFERRGYEQYRSLVINTLEKLDIPYIELKGRYTTEEIRAIYRQCSIYFVCSRESFGLPIAELQLCGCCILTPYKEWCPAHFIDKSPFESGTGELGSNFYFYDNNEEILRNQLLNIKATFDANQIMARFKKEYPDYYKINLDELRMFINKLKIGDINADSHQEYKEYNKLISIEDDIVLY